LRVEHVPEPAAGRLHTLSDSPLAGSTGTVVIFFGVSLTELPADLPVPVDDGAADHLPGLRMPALRLASTAGRLVDLGALGAGRTVVYCYPMTGRPDRPVPAAWDAIPGARGCTPESCGFRDHARNLENLGATIFGVSAQATEDQREAAERLRLPFELLSDRQLEVASALRLPTFQVTADLARLLRLQTKPASGDEGEGDVPVTLLRRLTMVVREGLIERVFYPIFPPDRHAEEVLRWLGSVAG